MFRDTCRPIYLIFGWFSKLSQGNIPSVNILRHYHEPQDDNTYNSIGLFKV